MIGKGWQCILKVIMLELTREDGMCLGVGETSRILFGYVKCEMSSRHADRVVEKALVGISLSSGHQLIWGVIGNDWFCKSWDLGHHLGRSCGVRLSPGLSPGKF